MAYIRFPWHVKVEDGYYAPGELIEVSNPEDYRVEGAEIINVPKEAAPSEAAEVRPRRGRPRKES